MEGGWNSPFTIMLRQNVKSPLAVSGAISTELGGGTSWGWDTLNRSRIPKPRQVGSQDS